MPPVNRNEPKRAKSSESRWSLMEFMRDFPDDAACLDFLWRQRFAPDGHTADCPACERPRRFHRVKDRPAYDCDTCGHHLHPTAGTIFHKSSTSLHLWFYAIHMMTSTRCGLSAKQLEREIGVTYKTAWRMLNLIRTHLMEQDGDSLNGEVEVDETYHGGKPRAKDIRRHRESRSARQAGARWADEKKTTVFGMVERGGRVRAVVLPKGQSTTTWKGTVSEHVLPASTIFTDEHVAYKGLDKTHAGHHRIRHSQSIYVEGNVHTNTIEGFFSLVKSGIRGTYHAVSRKWLPSYLNEFAWRYNHRDDSQAMFETLLLRAALLR